jgi:hypothetical protein
MLSVGRKVKHTNRSLKSGLSKTWPAENTQPAKMAFLLPAE